MKILLVYPPVLRSADICSVPIPIGLLQVAACLRDEGHQIKVLNLEPGGSITTVSIREMRNAYKNNNPIKYITNPESSYRMEFRCVLLDFQPDLVGFSCATEQVDAIRELTADAKRLIPDLRVECGGVHCTTSEWSKRVSEAALNFEPALDLLAEQNPPESFGSILTSHGCPYECTFCGSPKHFGRKLTLYPIQRVRRRVEDAIRAGASRIHIVDDSLTLKKERAVELANLMAEFAVPWRSQTRIDALVRNPSLVKYFKEHGCSQLTFGVESGSVRLLRLMKKHLERDQVLMAVDLLNAADLPYTANFMIGYPSETDEDVDASISLIREMNPQRVLGGSVVPYPGAAVHEDYPDFVDKASKWPYCRWSPFDPEFLCDENGNRFQGPSAKAIDAFYSLIEKVNDHPPTKGTFSTVSRSSAESAQINPQNVGSMEGKL